MASDHHEPATSPDEPTSWGVVAFLLAFAVLATALFGLPAAMQLHTAVKVWEAQGFERVQGTVISSEVHASSGSSRKGRSSRPTYSPRVTYRYTIADHVYEGGKYQYGVMSSSDGLAWSQHVVATHPAGSPVTIWYDPRNPATAVIERGWPPDYGAFWLLTQIFTGISILIPCLGISLWRSNLAVARFLAGGGWQPGWSVPDWGSVAATAEGESIGGGFRIFAAASTIVFFHGVACMVIGLMLLLAAALGGDWIHRSAVIWAAYAVAVLPVLAYMVMTPRKWFFPVLSIEHAARRLALTTALVRREASWTGIRGWRVAARMDGKKTRFAVLVVFADGEVTVWTWADREVAARVAGECARVTGGRLITAPA